MNFPTPRAALLAVLTLACLDTAGGQTKPSYYEYPRAHLKWYTMETPHFNVVFHGEEDGASSSRTAQVVSRIAEEIYGPVTELYQYEPSQKVSIILKDYEDYSNGAAYFFDNKIEIWVPALDSPLRGEHNWLRNVITHEFTHIVQIQKTMKGSRRVPFFYAQWLNYEDVRRPDVLYGYPNVIASYPIPIISTPAWFAEGTAQYQRAGLDYDTWDSHRDMLLRTRVLTGNELSLSDMGGFYSHTSLLRESVYNHGFAFTRYLAGTYGEDALRRISASLGSWSNWNIERAMRDAIGEDGDAVYRAWIDTMRTSYTAAIASVEAHEIGGELLERDGSHNFYPRFSADGKRLAYVSNRGGDFSATSLYIRDMEDGSLAEVSLEDASGPAWSYTCSMGHRIKGGVSGSFSWHPNGELIAYSRLRESRRGHNYSDLYVLDVKTRKGRQVTKLERAAQPEFSPDGKTIAFVTQKDGTQNLRLVDVATGEVRGLTAFEGGAQITDPRWHPSGQWVYFALFSGSSRDLYRIAPFVDRAGTPEAVLATGADERSPAFGREGDYLYYSSDASGIFNVYRVRLSEGLISGEPERLTNVSGGAFMPDVSPVDDGVMSFARYEWDGYKIASLEAVRALEGDALAAYSPPQVLSKPLEASFAGTDWQRLNAFDDSDVRPLPAAMLAAVGNPGETEAEPLAGLGRSEAAHPDRPPVQEYRTLFTSFSFYPVYRYDGYVKRRADAGMRFPDRSRGETLLRNSKVGMYVSSREIREGLSLLGGLLVAPTSTDADGIGDFISPGNLLKLERDAFLQFDYGKGFGIFPGRWSPQVSVELYNIRRNVTGGLAIEEFPCTTCYPDTTYADLSYNLWEASFAVRGKINRSLLLEVKYRFSPYRVTTERFFSREENQTISSSSSRYYIGRAVGLKAYYESVRPHRHGDVVPDRTLAQLSYEYEPGRLLQRFEVRDGLLVPGYETFHVNRLVLDVKHGFRLKGRFNGGAHGLDFRLRGTTVLGGEVDSFFNDYAGGLIGARGYPFYALGGNETAWLQVAYTFPVIPSIGRQAAFAYVDKVYLRVYADAAAAWSGSFDGVGAFRKDVGAEVRMALGSFYLLPTSVFLSGTYGLDSFDVELNDGFVAADGRNAVRYGRSLLWHFGVLFDFDL